MKLKKWEIWLAGYRFDDGAEVKNRPVLILDTEDSNNSTKCLCAKMTSHEPRNRHEYALAKWQYSGLSRETTIRTAHTRAIQSSDLLYKIGDMHPSDISGFQKMLMALKMQKP
jgi:mRNA-degrading endonuclease toxin of MazEF toxin-antitoxin module